MYGIKIEGHKKIKEEEMSLDKSKKKKSNLKYYN